MWLFVLAVVSQVEPMYRGGAAPHAMNTVGPVDESVGTSPCTVETLRERVRCTFDGKPAPAVDPERQRQDNQRWAAAIGQALCYQRAEQTTASTSERATLARACIARVEATLHACTLDGAEAPLDASGLFSPRAQGCYVALASATQETSVPAPSREPAAAPASSSSAWPKVERL